MCQVISYPEGKRDIRTLRDLLSVVDRRHVVIDKHYCREGQSRDDAFDESLDCCLCPYDLKATFANVPFFTLETTGRLPEFVLRTTSQAIASGDEGGK